MAREGVTYEMVAAVADKTVGEGGNVTIMGVRDALGTGSPNTIHRHLQVWRSMRPQAAAAAFELPAELANAFGRELAKAAAAARAEIEEQLVESQMAADHLSNVGEALEGEREELVAQLAAMTTERDAAVATAAAHATEIQRLVESVDRERKSAEEARLELAKAELTTEAKDRWIEEQGIEIKALKADLAEAQGAKQAAAVEVSRLQAEVAAERTAKAELIHDRDSLKEALKAAGDRLSQAQADAAAERKVAGETLAAARADVAEVQSQAAAERKVAAEGLAQAKAEARELDSRVAALMAELKGQAEALAQAKAKGDAQTTELAQALASLATATAKAEGAVEAKAAAVADLAALRAELAEGRAELKAERQAHKADLAALRQELGKAQADLVEARKPVPIPAAK